MFLRICTANFTPEIAAKSIFACNDFFFGKFINVTRLMGNTNSCTLNVNFLYGLEQHFCCQGKPSTLF